MCKRILLTGGNGYIGSHCAIVLIENGYDVVIFDNLSNSSAKCFDRICSISGKKEKCKLIIGDINDKKKLEDLFVEEGPFDGVIHFAAYKSVSESVHDPLKYYKNNVSGTLILLEVMKENNCKNLIFSSSATVYGNSKSPLSEDSMTGNGITNPYGWSKFMMEQILRDVQKSEKEMNVILLRYFNPVGAHPSGEIGENPNGIPNNLMPYIQQVAIGCRDHVNVFGNDYNTIDGSGVRDYIHVMDLAEGHLSSLNWLFSRDERVMEVFNLGSGGGYSVMEMIKGMEKACGHELKYEICNRREGDLDICYCDGSKSEKILGWKTKYGLDDICRDSWNWQKKNPNGFE